MKARLMFILMFLVMAFNAYCLTPADVNKDQQLTSEILNSGIKIVDIRTEAEWKESGIVPGAYTIMFYDKDGNAHLDEFEAELDKIVAKDEPFALICRSSKRTGKAVKILREEGYSKIVDLEGGLKAAKKNGVELVPYTVK